MSNGKLILVRHGLSVYNDQNRFTGWKDVELNQQGIDEAKQAAEPVSYTHLTLPTILLV